MSTLQFDDSWDYHSENQWIHRDVSGEEGEIWCEFREPPEPDDLEWLLESLNEREGCSPQTFDKHELAMIDRALQRLISPMVGSRFIGEEDPHLAKCEALRVKVAELKESV